MKNRKLNFIFIRNLFLSGAFIYIIFFFWSKNGFFMPDFLSNLKVLNKETVSKAEKSYNENFYDKMAYIEKYSLIQHNLHKTVLDDAVDDRSVIFGKNDILYYAVPKRSDTAMMSQSIADFGRFAEKSGSAFLYVQAPVKNLPGNTNFPKGIIDYSYINSHDMNEKLSVLNIKTLNLSDAAVKQGMKDENMFFKTDTHWNIITAFWGYSEIMKTLDKDFNIKPDNYNLTCDLKNYTVKTWKETYIGSCGKRIGKDAIKKRDDLSVLLPQYQTNLSYFKYDKHGKLIKKREGDFKDALFFYGYLNMEDPYQDKYIVFMDWGASEDIIINNDPKVKGKVLVIKDSFAMPVCGFLSQNFKEIRLIDIRKENKPQNVYEYIKAYSPDLTLFISSPTSMYYSPEMFLNLKNIKPVL